MQSGLEGGEHGDHRGRRLWQHDPDPVPAPATSLFQEPGQAVGAALQFAIGNCLVAEDNGGRLRPTLAPGAPRSPAATGSSRRRPLPRFQRPTGQLQLELVRPGCRG